MSWRVGLIRLELAAYWAIGAYSTALLMSRLDWPFWPTMLVGGLIAVLLGWIFSQLTLRRGGLVFFAFSVAFGLIIQQVLGTVPFFGGWAGIADISSPSIGSFVFDQNNAYFLGLFLIAITIAVFYSLYNSKIGRAWSTIGSDVKLAQSLGINVVRYQTATVVLGSFFAALSGSFFASYLLYITPKSFSFYQSITVPMYCLLGGISHYIAGPIIGAALLTFIPQYLKPTAEMEPIFTGIVIILFVIFMPNGVLGLIEGARRSSFRSRFSSIADKVREGINTLKHD